MGRLRNLRLQSLRRWETAVVILVFVLLILWYFMGQQQSDSETEAARLERQLSAVRRQIVALQEENNLDALQEELDELKALPPPPAFPSRQRAFDFSAALFERAAGLGVDLKSVTSADDMMTIQGRDFNAVRYSAELAGEALALTDVLELFEVFPTTVTRSLDFTRREASWTMTTAIGVIYGPGNAAPAEEET